MEERRKGGIGSNIALYSALLWLHYHTTKANFKSMVLVNY